MKHSEYDLYREVLTESIHMLDHLECENPMHLVRLIKVKRELANLLATIPAPVNPDECLLDDLDSFFA